MDNKKLVDWILSTVDSADFKKTLLFLKTVTGRDFFSWMPEIYKFEKEFFRFFLIVLNYDNYASEKEEIILKNLQTYEIYKDRIIEIMKAFHFWEIFLLIDHWHRSKNVLYFDLYDIFLYHINHFPLKEEYTCSFLVKWYSLQFHIFQWAKDWHDSSNSLFFEIRDHWIKIFWFSLYIWEQTLFISNLQYTNDYYKKYGGIKKLRLHKYAFYYMKKLAETLWKSHILAFSDENHCNRYLDWFFPIYDSIFAPIGMIKNPTWYWQGQISLLDIRDRNNSDFVAWIQDFMSQIVSWE